MNIPAFKNDGHEAEYWHIFDHYKSRYLDCLQDVKEAMFPGYAYNQLSGPCIDNIRQITDEIIYAATQDFERAHSEYKDEGVSFYVREGSLKDSMKEALKDFWHGDMNNDDS